MTHEITCQATTALRASKGRSLFLLLAVVTILPATARAQFSVQPVILGLAPMDTAVTGVVSVRNEGKEPIQFRFRMGDFDQTLSGDHVFQRFGENANSCKGRVEVSPDQASLKPGERQQLRVRMTPGATTCWGVLFVEHQARNTSGIMVAQQIAVKVYGTQSTPLPTGDITTVSAAHDTAGVNVTFDFKNSGRGPVRPFGSVEIRTETGQVVASETVDAFSVLPSHTRRVAVAVRAKLAPGRYVAVPVMDFGADYLAGGQAAFAVP
jgi:hypothetical protein